MMTNVDGPLKTIP